MIITYVVETVSPVFVIQIGITLLAEALKREFWEQPDSIGKSEIKTAAPTYHL
jgi:hypothetical protein